MAVFQPVPLTAELRVTYASNVHDRLYNNIVYFTRGGGWSASTVQTLADEARLRFTTGTLEDLMPQSARAVEFRARDLSTEFGAVGINSTEVLGTETGELEPPNCAAMIRFISGGGPPRRGGIFWPYVFTSDVSETGELSTNYRTTRETEIRAWLEGIEVAMSVTHVIVSRYRRATPPEEGSVLREPNAVTAQVLDYQTLKRIASQRDRRPRLAGF